MIKTNSQWMSDAEYISVTKLTPIPTVNLVILRSNKETLFSNEKKSNWEVLLIVRKTGYAKGQWCMIGGRVRIGETLAQAIKRHAKDLAVKIQILPPFNPNFPSYIDDRSDQDKTKHPISLIYPAKIISGQVQEEGEEYKGYKWFPVNKLPKMGYKQRLQIMKTLEQLE